MSSSDKLSQRMYEIQAKQKSLHDQLHNLEKQIYALETKYLEDTQAYVRVPGNRAHAALGARMDRAAGCSRKGSPGLGAVTR